MKIKVNVASWKKAVSKAYSLAGKNSGNPNESCVLISIKQDNSYLFVLEAGVHNTKIRLTDIEIEEEGSCFIQATSLDSLTKAIFSKELTIKVKNNKLIYDLGEGLGSICEAVYHNQNPFHGMVFATEDYTLVEEGTTPFTKLLKSELGNFADKLGKDTKSTLSILLNKDNSLISGNLSMPAGLVYSFNSNANSCFSIKTDLLKSMSFILEELDSVKLEKGSTTLKLSSNKGEAILAIGKVNEQAITHLINSFKQKEDSLVLLKSDQLVDVIKLQSYGFQDGDCISIKSEEDSLVIKGQRTEEAAKLEYTEASPFNEVNLPTEDFTKMVAIPPKDSVVTLKTTLTQIANRVNPIKTAFLVVETDGYVSTSYLCEPNNLK